MSRPIPKPWRRPFVMISCVVDTTNMARNDASVYMKAPIKPTCLRDSFFNAIFAENPGTREKVQLICKFYTRISYPGLPIYIHLSLLTAGHTLTMIMV